MGFSESDVRKSKSVCYLISCHEREGIFDRRQNGAQKPIALYYGVLNAYSINSKFPSLSPFPGKRGDSVRYCSGGI